MESLAPPVVAVIVAHDPGPWFDETLASFAAQDYAEFSVLVLDCASREDLTGRVAASLPTAYVRRFDENHGYGATSNQVRSMVDGASYFLFCHDDVALFPDTVHLLVEEAFRSNAGIVSPKVVSWDDPDRLVHVGMTVDKGGSVTDRVQPNEIDHGQHDAVRDVFVAPGGCTLVRADLFEELDGFDPTIVAMGEDLDLCWRAQVAGARVIVVPDARVRHLEEMASGARPIEASLVGASHGRHRHPVTLQELQRRHELRAVFKCYGPFHLLRVVPQLLVLTLGELMVAAVAGNRNRVRAVTAAWRWNFRHVGDTRRQRRQVQSLRRISDKEIRQLQVSGSARLSAYVSRVLQLGFRGAHADELASPLGEAETGFSGVIEEFVESDPGGAGRPAPFDQEVLGSDRGRLSGRVRLLSWLIAAFVVIVGSRSLLTGSIPSVGQFVPFPDWSATFAQFGAGWHPSGVGSTAPASPALALVGGLGTVLVGAMGLTQKVLIFACVPLGAWGMVRLVRPFGSQRATLVAGIVYLAVPVPYDALALGRLGSLVVYAGAPWVFGHLFRFTGISPFAPAPRVFPARTRTEVASRRPGRRRSRSNAGRPAGGRWLARHRTLRSLLLLGVLEAILVSFVPAAAIVVVLAGAAVAVSSIVLGQPQTAARALWLSLGSTVVAGFLCLPWLIGVLSAGRGAIGVFGIAGPTSGAASWADLLRFSVGPIGNSPLAWAFGLAALLPLLLARGPRFGWAGRCWSIALAFWFVAWVIGRGWTGSLAIDPAVLLGPAAAAISMAIGLGIAAFEEDLPASTFGWKQLATAGAVAAMAVGAIPTLASALPGRWDLPQNDFSQTVAWMHADTKVGGFRVLWLGDPRALNQGSWSAGDGLAYATSEGGAPDASWLWSAAGPGPASRLANAVNQARTGRTDQLGSMLAPAGVRYIVEVTALAPIISQVQTPTSYPTPADLTPALAAQLDLQSVFTESGISVYQNNAWIPERSVVSPTSAAAATAIANGSSGTPDVLGAAPGSPIVPGAVPVLPGPPGSRSYRGTVPAGIMLTALAPAGQWSLTAPTGKAFPMTTAFGWAGQYRVDRGGQATLHFDGPPWGPLSVAFELILWALVVAALVERRGVMRPWLRSVLQRRRRRRRPEPRQNSELDFEPDGEQFGGLGG
ncbi:MAG TPA: glycosyltransferase [Acidimicrobiales bacterium]|nr:glycosyltransferase [Acidimicrobiales bacterium]